MCRKGNVSDPCIDSVSCLIQTLNKGKIKIVWNKRNLIDFLVMIPLRWRIRWKYHLAAQQWRVSMSVFCASRLPNTTEMHKVYEVLDEKCLVALFLGTKARSIWFFCFKKQLEGTAVQGTCIFRIDASVAAKPIGLLAPLLDLRKKKQKNLKSSLF